MGKMVNEEVLKSFYHAIYYPTNESNTEKKPLTVGVPVNSDYSIDIIVYSSSTAPQSESETT